MSHVSTIQVHHPQKKGECIVINASDFDPSLHERYEVSPDTKDRFVLAPSTGRRYKVLDTGTSTYLFDGRTVTKADGQKTADSLNQQVKAGMEPDIPLLPPGKLSGGRKITEKKTRKGRNQKGEQ